MAEPVRRSHRIAVDVRWPTIFKLLATAALVWVWLTLVQLILVLVVAVLLAVTLNPIVDWFERRGWARWSAAALIFISLVVLLGGFGWLTWTSVNEQASYASSHFSQLEHDLLERLPPWVRDAAGGGGSGDGVQSSLAMWGLRFARSAVSAIVVSVLGLILTMYLVVEAQATSEWLLAFVPKDKRGKAEQTIGEAQRVIFAYVAGNVLTSVIATVVVLILLSVMRVPAALLLALIAGLFDFVPVIGFIASSVFAVAMSLTVSPSTALIVLGLYIAYHMIENYVISPWAYGDRLKLSNVAVILAFAIGGELAGVIGALIALPIAAAYPAIERIWLREKLPEDTVREHQELNSELNA
ncbi:MAG: putative rane protein [Acidobacteria bacterium]|nr:putative rane protein [Acidobacteriota bacterium]